MILGKLVATRRDFSPTVARVVLGGVMLPHGLMKLGAFGAPDLSANLDYLTGDVGLPTALALLVVFIEVVGSLALIVGVLTRPAALGMAAVMIGAAVTEHASHGFFMNWFGDSPAGVEGYEYHVLTLGMSIPLMLSGAGAFSVDRIIARSSTHAHP